jgi:hypothetical protein
VNGDGNEQQELSWAREKKAFLEVIFSKETYMASKAKTVNTELVQPDTTVEERERLRHSAREQEIRNRAYEIYLERGAQPGYEVEDWLQAERELNR